DVVGGVTDHDDFGGGQAETRERGYHNVGIRLRVLGVTRRRHRLHVIARAGDLEKWFELFLLRRAGDGELDATPAHPLEELCRSGERMQGGKVLCLEDLRAPLADTLSLVTVRRHTDHFREELIAAHPDERSYLL